jgi:hypothetical protein
LVTRPLDLILTQDGGKVEQVRATLVTGMRSRIVTSAGVMSRCRCTRIPGREIGEGWGTVTWIIEAADGRML